MCSNTPLVPVLAGIELAGRHQSLLRNGLGISQWKASNGTVHHLGVFRFCLFLSHLMMIITIIYFVSIIKLLISQPTSFTFFSLILVPCPPTAS